MMKLLNKAKNIVEEASINGIDLEFNVQINNDKPRNYSDILFNLNEVNTVKKAVVELEKKYSQEKSKKMLEHLDEFLSAKKIINNINTLIIKTEGCEVSVLKDMLDTLQNQINGFVFIANINDDSVNFLAKCSKELEEKINCGQIVKEVSIESNGNGGGSKVFASGGAQPTSGQQRTIVTINNNTFYNVSLPTGARNSCRNSSLVPALPRAHWTLATTASVVMA